MLGQLSNLVARRHWKTKSVNEGEKIHVERIESNTWWGPPAIPTSNVYHIFSTEYQARYPTRNVAALHAEPDITKEEPRIEGVIKQDILETHC